MGVTRGCFPYIGLTRGNFMDIDKAKPQTNPKSLSQQQPTASTLDIDNLTTANRTTTAKPNTRKYYSNRDANGRFTSGATNNKTSNTTEIAKPPRNTPSPISTPSSIQTRTKSNSLLLNAKNINAEKPNTIPTENSFELLETININEDQEITATNRNTTENNFEEERDLLQNLDLINSINDYKTYIHYQMNKINRLLKTENIPNTSNKDLILAITAQVTHQTDKLSPKPLNTHTTIPSPKAHTQTQITSNTTAVGVTDLISDSDDEFFDVPLTSPIKDPDHSNPALDGLKKIIVHATAIPEKLNETKSVTRSNKLEAIKHSESIKRITESIAINIKENPETQIINTDPKLNKDTIKAIQTTIKNTLKEQLQTPISLPTQSRSYAAIVKTPYIATQSPTSPHKTKPSIIVTANRQVKSPNETLQLWRQSISFTDTNFTPSHIKFVSNNKLRVEFDSEEQRQTTIDKVNLSANKLVKAEEARLLQPMQYGHTRKHCTNDKLTCSHCASTQHTYNACPNKNNKDKNCCINCHTNNNKYKLNLPTTHSATSFDCPRKQSMIINIRNKINYG
ncbi:hypothetical protein ACJJTC_007667 [Scirpophaga incertulas]